MQHRAVWADGTIRRLTGSGRIVSGPSGEPLIDPDTAETLPGPVVAASGFDVLSHALESFTARPFTARSKTDVLSRPLSQGANPWSDVGCRAALRLCGRYLVRAVQDASDREARGRQRDGDRGQRDEQDHERQHGEQQPEANRQWTK